MFNLFKKEPYPNFKEEWDNPDNTIYREFYLTNSNDYNILCDLVKTHMSDSGNEGLTRYRLIKLLQDESNRRYYLQYQKRMHPYTYLLKWYLHLTIEFFHRRLKTKKFKNQVQLSKISRKVTNKWINLN